MGVVANDWCIKVRKVAKNRNQYNQVPHLTQDIHVKVTKTQLNITNEGHVEQAKLSKQVLTGALLSSQFDR